MIKSISIKNFKGIGDEVSIDLKPITLLFGANSAGKSTIVHALHYAREIFERRNYNPDMTATGGKYIDLGGFEQLVHGKRNGLHRRVCLRLDVAANEDDIAIFETDYDVLGDNAGIAIDSLLIGVESVGVELQLEYTSFADRVFVAESHVFVNGQRLFTLESSAQKGAKIVNLDHQHPCLTRSQTLDEESALQHCLHRCEDVFINGPESQLVFPSMIDALPSLGSKIRFDIDKPSASELASLDELASMAWDDGFELMLNLQSAFSDLIVGPFQLVADALQQFRYLGPLRETPERSHTPPKSKDESRWASGLAAWDELKLQPDDFVTRISSWLGDSDRLNCGCQLDRRSYYVVDKVSELAMKIQRSTFADDADPIQPHEIADIETLQRLKLVSTSDESVELDPSDVGVGISQVVPVLVSSLLGKEHLVAIEQPELHVHPRVQAELGNLFIDAAINDENCFILETHSEHLIARIQRTIRRAAKSGLPPDGSISPDLVAIYYVSQAEGETQIDKIDLDSRGDFVQPWPDDFFEIGFNEKFGE